MANSASCSHQSDGWEEKQHQMKRIINHFLGDIPFDAENLKNVADNLTTNPNSSDIELRQPAAAVEDYSLDPVSTNTICMSTGLMTFESLLT